MNSRTIGLKTAGVLFSLFCLGHVARLIGQVEVSVAGTVIPMGASVIGAVVGACLATWMWRLSRPEAPGK